MSAKDPEVLVVAVEANVDEDITSGANTSKIKS